MNSALQSIPLCRRLCAMAFASLLLCQGLQAIPLRVLAWDDEIAARKLAIAGAKEFVTIQAMHPSKRTKVYQVIGGDKPVTIQALDKTDKDGKPATCGILLPPAIKQALLVILPDAKAATGLRLVVLEDDAPNFPWGCSRFINACGRKLAFVYEKKLTALPVSWEPVLVNPGGDNRNMEVQIFLFDDPQRPIYSAVWEQRQEVRTLIFIVPGEDPRLGPVAMKMISEDRRVKEREAKAAAANHAPPDQKL
jgi:hypothetical protein